MTERKDLEGAYLQGWAACYVQATAKFMQALTAVQPDPGNVPLIRCQQCQQLMEIGQPARTLGRDAFNLTLWEHVICPPMPEGDDVPVQQDEDQGDEDQEETQQELTAICAGSMEGPWVIYVAATNGAFLQRIDLDGWDSFRPASATHRLTENGFRVLPHLMMDPTTMGGWTPIHPYQYATRVVRWENITSTPINVEQPPADVVTADTDSGSGYTLPRRQRGQALAAQQAAQAANPEPEIMFMSSNELDHTTTHLIVNERCPGCGGSALMIIKYDPTGTWLVEKRKVCGGNLAAAV